MKWLALAALLVAGCSHGDSALREEQARARRYRDAWETQAAELQQLKARVLELEQRGCATAPRAAPATP